MAPGKSNRNTGEFAGSVAGRVFGWAFFLNLLFLLASGHGANTNPTIVFQASRTNSTNLVGASFSFSLYSLSGYTNLTNVPGSKSTSSTNTNLSTNNAITNQISVTTTRTYTNSRTFSNNIVLFDASFTNPVVNSNLTGLAGLNGLTFSAASGTLSGIPSTNFILNISNLGLVVTATNFTWTTTNLQIVVSNVVVTTVTNITTNATNVTISTNTTVSFTNSNAASAISNTTFTATNTPSYRFVFQSVPTVAFTNVFTNPANIFTTNTFTNIQVGSTNLLPSSFTNNGTNLSLVYTSIVGPVTYTPGNSNFVVNGPGRITLRVNVNTTNVNELWTAGTTSFTMVATNNPPSPGFGMQSVETTNTTNVATNLPYLGQSRLLFSNQPSNGIVQLALDQPRVGRFLVLTNTNVSPPVVATNFQALAGTGNATITAVLLPTATSGFATSRVTIALTPATNRVIWAGVYSNTNTYTITNPAVTNLVLQALATSGGQVIFSTTNSGISIAGSNVALSTNGTYTLSATPAPADPFLWVSASTNVTLVVAKSTLPIFTSTNRKDGTVGTNYTNFLTLGATNGLTNPMSFSVANFAPGLSLAGSNLIGAVTNAGLYQMTLTASNAGGTGVSNLVSLFTNSNNFLHTSPWFFRISLGVGTNTNGTYLFGPGEGNTNDLPFGIAVLSNTSNPLPGSVVLTNGNSAFVGTTNLRVRYIYTNVVGGVTNTNTSTNDFLLTVDLAAPTLFYGGGTNTSTNVSVGVGQGLTISPSTLQGTTSNYPVRIQATNLPPGLVINPTSGIISGQPFTAGVYASAIWATNASTNHGGSSATSSIVFNITARAMAGMPIRLPLSGIFSNQTGTYAVIGLPPGVTLDASTGFLGGVPQIPGTFPLILTLTPSGGGATSTNTYSLEVLPPAPILQLPAGSVSATRGGAFYLQPWVTGAGWEWAGQDTLTNPSVSTRWSFSLATNSNGVLRPLSVAGAGYPLCYSNRTTNYNHLTLGWRGTNSVPVATPWMAQVRVQTAANLTRTAAYLETYLGIFGPGLSATNSADVSLWARTNGQFPSALGQGAISLSNSLAAVSTGQELGLRAIYQSNDLRLLASTNPSSGTYVSVLVLSNLTNGWNLTNPFSMFGLRLGAESSNQATANNLVRFRHFSVQPAGLTYSASNLPPGLSIDAASGTITGTPTQTGVWSTTVSVSNGQGSSQSVLTITIR